MSTKTKLTIELPVEMKADLLAAASAEGDSTKLSPYLRKIVRDHLKMVKAVANGDIDALALRARDLGVDVRDVISVAIAQKEQSEEAKAS
jgi:hypothetical protein